MSFPDAVQIMVSRFNGFEGHPAAAEPPKDYDHRSPFIQVVDNGGPGITEHVFDGQRLTFFVTNPSRATARRVCDGIRESIHQHTGGTWYWVSDTSSVYYLPDPDVGQHRYAYTARINTKRV